MEKVKDKDSLLKKLRLFSSTPDDDNNRFKQKIYHELIQCPELLYAINEKKYESELFNKDGSINYDGEWDLYFSDSIHDSNIRPYLFIPQTQTEVRNYVCYQTHFNELPRFNSTEKYGLITFTIIVNGEDRMDKLTGVPRHDLIAAILKDKFNWTNVFGTQCHVIEDKESITDNNYIVRTLVFQTTNLNNIVQTSTDQNGKRISTSTINKLGRM